MRRLLGSFIAVLVLLGMAPALSSTLRPEARPTTDPYLAKLIATKAPTTPFTAFISGTSTDTAASAARQAGFVVARRWDLIDTVVARGTLAQAATVLKAKGVTHVEADRAIAFATDTSHKATRSEEARAAFNGADGNPLDGRGVSVAIVDSGVDGNHAAFAGGAVVRNMKMVCPQGLVCDQGDPTAMNENLWVDVTGAGNDSDSISAGGHGTHVASIAAGRPFGPDGKFHGSAIGASIVGLSVGNALSVYGGGEGLYWVLAHHDAPCGTGVAASACPAIKVVNNSWGPAFVAGVANNFDPNSAIVKIQRRLVAGGVTVVWSAGNGDEATGDGGDGSDNRVNQYAQDPTDGVIAVANYDDQATGTRDGSLDSSSSRGKAGLQNSYPDIAAPGHNITAACTLTLPVCTSFGYAGGAMPADPNSYNTISGTSMAAPHISGIVAQLTQANPSLTPAQIENVVKDTAYKFTFGAAYEADSLNAGGTTSFDKGAGLVDVVAAAASILNVPAPPAPLVCGPGSPQVLDPAGDANEVILVGNTPTPSEDSLDVTEGRLSWDASASAITFNIKVTDWTGTEPAGADGVLFDFTFSYGGASYYIDASSTTTGGDSFLLGNYNPTRTTLTPLSGSFNAATDTISVVLPTALFNSKVAGATMGAGSVLNGFEIVSRRDEVFVVPNADTANGVCPFTAA